MNKIESVDLLIIGGGINGTGIARDAAGRGYSVALAEKNDFASGTSSASTKLFHGGLRYLEFFEFRLVREALQEREILLQAMPHISWPMRFILPLHPQMRFASNTSASKLLSILMPWRKGTRPSWLIRLGLLLYDHMGGRQILPPTARLSLGEAPEGKPLEPHFTQAFEYSDCWIEDSRLTLLNARDAQRLGATMLTRTRVTSARVTDGVWSIMLEDQHGTLSTCQAKMIINAGGPWVMDVIENVTHLHSAEAIRLVRGSHIVTKRLYDHDKCYFLQGSDGRIMFTIPYEEDYTLIGTTDAAHVSVNDTPHCTEVEVNYMIDFVNQYFRNKLNRDDIVWTFSGVRPLYDEGEMSATAATRDYFLRTDFSAGAAMLNIFGGKITTYRRLAESALEHINSALQCHRSCWTAGVALPGGDCAIDDIPRLQAELGKQLPFLDCFTIRRLIRQYGTECLKIFAGARSPEDLGQAFGHGVTAREIDWAITHEWVCTAEDFLWRRSKMGLRFSPAQVEVLAAYIKQQTSQR